MALFDFTTAPLDPRLTFSRTSVANYFNSAGVLVQAAANAPRLPNYDPVTMENLGLLLEIATNNLITNNTMVGAVAGAPGTTPNLWAMDGDGNGLVRTIVGVGQEDGIDYMDVRYAGTTLAAGSISVLFRADLTAVASTPAQQWATSCFYRLMAGSVANAVFNQCIVASDGAVILGDNAAPFVPTNAKLRTQRARNSGTLAAFAGTTRSNSRLRVDVAALAAVDFTLRIGLPQWEGGLIVSSPIKTTNAIVSRAIDICTCTGANFTSWFTNQTEGTFVANYVSQINQTGHPWCISDGTTQNQIRHRNGTPTVDYTVSSANVLTASGAITIPGRTDQTRILSAVAYEVNNYNIAANGILGIPDTNGAMPVGTFSKLNIGTFADNTACMGGSIKSLDYIPERVSDDMLRTLSSDPQLWVGGILVSSKPALRVVFV